VARCQGKTKSGAQCKRQAIEGSEYCSAHQPAEGAEGAEDQDLTQDLMLIALGLAATGVMFLVLRSVGRWFPRI
jgi:hypothetical protein